jgi:tripartite-type tricarboxylate transporter receptor subunit TctC
MNDRRTLILAGLALAGSLPSARAQSWPSRPIRFVSATAAGGAIDATARAYGEFITQRTGQPVIVEARPGGQSMIAAHAVATAAPDGHTFLFAVNSALTQAPVLLKNAAVSEPDKAFAFVAGFSPGPALLLVKKDLPVSSLRDFVALAQRERLFIGSIGVGSRAHLVGIQMNKLLGTKLEVVPFKGAAPALQDLASGQIDCTIGSVAGSQALIQAGRIRPIAVTSGARTPKMPDLPTFGDEGYTQPVFRLRDWLVMAAPAGTPGPILARVAELLREATDQPAVVRARDASAVTERPLLLDEFAKALAEERPVWQNATRELGVTLD